jgi:hypothetical protein
MKKTASITRVSSFTELYVWMDKIPCRITIKDQERLVEALRDNKQITVLWTEHFGFRVW